MATTVDTPGRDDPPLTRAISRNMLLLVLRRDTVEHDHFHAPTAIPAIGAVVSLALMTTKDPDIFLRAGALLLLGAVLWLVNRALTGGAPGPTDTGVWKAVGRPD